MAAEWISSRTRAFGELAAMLATSGLFLVFENVLDLKVPFLIVCAVAWTAYIVARLVKERGLAAHWGLRLDNLKSAAAPLLGSLAIGIVALLVWHRVAGTRALPAGAWLLFLVYPVWSFLQQFCLQALVAANLERLGLSRVAVVPIAACLFGVAHLPDLPLAALCATAGLAWTAIYLRWRHLPLLALVHAWLGTLAFFWLLDRDPWGEFLKH